MLTWSAAEPPVVIHDLAHRLGIQSIHVLIFSIAVVAGWVLAVRKSINDRSGKPAKRKIPPIDESYASGG